MRMHRQQVAPIEFWRRRELELSASRTLVRLIVFDYKRARQCRRQSVRIQSALCEVACEENSRGLKIAVGKIDRTVVSVYTNRSLLLYDTSLSSGT